MRIAAPIEGAQVGPEQGRRFLPGIAFKALAALAEVVVDTDRLEPRQVAQNVDDYMTSFRAQRKWVVKVALVGLWLYPLRFLQPPFPSMDAQRRRRFVERRFVGDIAFGRVRIGRRLVQAMFRLSQQMAYLGFYGDERTYDSVGYKPFSQRERYARDTASLPERLPKVTCMSADEVGDRISADAVVVGSGAAGAIVAYRLAESGRSVIVLERGRHVDPSEFTENEVVQISNLYADGALQLSRDFSFQVLQGMCVGGSTVVNNAVCFDLPDRILATWNGPGHDAGLDPDRLAESFLRARDLVDVRRPPSPHLQGGASKFVEGIENLGLDQPPNEMNVVDTNISNCPGSGYCNIGCPFGTKLSMLDKVLPEGQQRFGDRLRILPECLAERIETSDGRARAVVARLGDGRKVRVEGETVVVSAGAIASSWLLMQSKIARSRAGRNLRFNMGSPITADFEQTLDSFDGVQISHYLEPPGEKGFVMETWFNPVVSQALNMPGWLDDHRNNMDRFRNLTAAGVLVGTQGSADLRPALTGGVDIVYKPAREDLRTLIEALKLLARIYLAADGVRRVMPSTFQFHEFTSEDQLDELDRYVEHSSYMSIGSGHPQGGNAISRNGSDGVVDPSLRVHGLENLYVCDASVFPTATTVNPQLTVMALAEYAAAGIADGDPRT